MSNIARQGLFGDDGVVTLKPDYDSGWVQTSSFHVPTTPPPAQEFTLTHNLNTTDLLVDIVRQIGHGAPEGVTPAKSTQYSWTLTSTTIKLVVKDQGMQFRVRLWKV